jgi:hypothetical protein
LIVVLPFLVVLAVGGAAGVLLVRAARRRQEPVPTTREERVAAARRTMRSLRKDSNALSGRRSGNSWSDGDGRGTGAVEGWGGDSDV